MSSISLTNEGAFAESHFRLKLPARERVISLVGRFVFASLLLVIAGVAIPYGTVEPWWISLYECAVFGLTALWICQGFVSNDWRIQDKALLAPVAVVAVFTFLQSVSPSVLGSGYLSTTISADPFETRLVFFKLLALTLNGVLLSRYVTNERRMRLLIYVVIGVAVASSLFGIARQTLQHSESGFLLPYLRHDSGFGQFVNKNHFAFLAEMAVGITAGLMFGGTVRRERLLLYISTMTLLWTALVLTSSRGALFSVFVQIIFITMMLIRARIERRLLQRVKPQAVQVRRRRGFIRALVLALAVVVAVAVSAVWLGGDLLVTRLTELRSEVQATAQEEHAGVRRREVWSATWQLIKAHPIAGSGFGAYGVAITQFHNASGQWTPEAAHNDYLELIASGGLIGAGLLIWFGISFTNHARRQLVSSNTFRRAACVGALTGISGVLSHSIVDFGLHVTANAVTFVVLVVIATRDLETNQREQCSPISSKGA